MRRFILQAIDPDFGCPILEAMLRVQDLDELRAILGAGADGDLELERHYTLEPEEVAAIERRFGVGFDAQNREIHFSPLHSIQQAPYLVHTGYELFLLLEGTKKFAAMGETYSDHRHHNEDLFDRHVAEGRLHREVHVAPIDPPLRSPDGVLIEGLREVFYTLKGEEWRVRAWQLIFEAAPAVRWNDTLERLQGMLFGYEPEQIEWWIAHCREHRNWGTVRVYCTVTAGVLAWIEAAGYRALPKLDADGVALTILHERPDAERAARLWDRAESVALIRMDVNTRFMFELAEAQGKDSRYSLDCALPAVRIPDLNRNIVGAIEVFARSAG